MDHSEALVTAREGDCLPGTALQSSCARLVALANSLERRLAEHCTFADVRRLLRRANSLNSLAACLPGIDIALLPGQPKVGPAHIDAAVAWAAERIEQTGGLAEAVARIDQLLNFFVAVLGGDGGAMLQAALRLRRGPGLPVAGAEPRRLRLHIARPWETAQYVLLPMQGMRAPEMAMLERGEGNTLAAPQAAVHGGAAPAASAPLAGTQLLHSLHNDGAKLAELTSYDVRALKVSDPGVRAMPLVLYDLCRRPLVELSSNIAVAGAAAKASLTVRVLRAGGSQDDGVAGAHVIAFTDFASRTGTDGISDSHGDVVLALDGAGQPLDTLVIYGPAGYWGYYQQGVTLTDGATLALQGLDLAQPDYAAVLYGAKPATAGQGVTVGVIDTGVDLGHPDLRVAGGAAFVVDENDQGGPGPALSDGEHGSHVAGIIASVGAAPSGKRGVAPSAKLMSYRVFPNLGGGASNYDIIRAIDRGVADGCDLLNLSLGSANPDEAVREAIKSAFEHGTLCIVAAGNDSRSPVSYPAKWPEAVAVSALGKRGTFPDGSTEQMDALAPFSPQDAAVFVAGFSNVGPEIDLAGPGVGIVSTVPGGRYAVMSGTSMACPAVTGAAAALLGLHPDVLAMARDSQRALAMLALLNGAAGSLGFGAQFQGLGVPR